MMESEERIIHLRHRPGIHCLIYDGRLEYVFFCEETLEGGSDFPTEIHATAALLDSLDNESDFEEDLEELSI